MTEKPTEEANQTTNQNIEEKENVPTKMSKFINKCDLCDTFKDLLSDRTFFIALLVIVSFVILSFSLIFALGLDAFKDMASVWGAWVGAVIGYFFGSKQIEALTKRIDTVLDDYDDSSEDYEAEIDDLKSDLANLDEKYNKAIKDIQFITIKYGKQFNNNLLERLKKDYEISILDEDEVDNTNKTEKQD